MLHGAEHIYQDLPEQIPQFCTGWCSPVLSWFITPMNTIVISRSTINHSEMGVMFTNLSNELELCSPCNHPTWLSCFSEGWLKRPPARCALKMTKVCKYSIVINHSEMGIVNHSWLVAWNIYFSICWECHHPTWRTHIFQRGRYCIPQPPTR